MSVLLRATELEGRPIVTLAGESPAEVKDVIFDSAHGTLLGLTLRGHGLFSRPRKEILPWLKIHSIGRDAVVIRDEHAFQGEDALPVDRVPENRNVIGNQVLTDAGTDVGRVVDVIIEAGAEAEIVGYEVEASEALATHGEHVLIPLPAAIAVSGEHLIVPVGALDFVGNDLSGFGAAVEAFRAKLREAS
jgi:sporulation protein YlmC with PRC-barrel domain